jgi:hypothetical protein
MKSTGILLSTAFKRLVSRKTDTVLIVRMSSAAAMRVHLLVQLLYSLQSSTFINHTGFCLNLCSSQWYQSSGLGISVVEHVDELELSAASNVCIHNGNDAVNMTMWNMQSNQICWRCHFCGNEV